MFSHCQLISCSAVSSDRRGVGAKGEDDDDDDGDDDDGRRQSRLLAPTGSSLAIWPCCLVCCLCHANEPLALTHICDLLRTEPESAGRYQNENVSLSSHNRLRLRLQLRFRYVATETKKIIIK